MSKTFVKNIFLYGLISGMICVLVAVIQYYGLGHNPFGRFKLPAYGINVFFIFASIWAFRIKNGGLISFPQAFGTGFFTNLISAFFAAVVFFIFVKIEGTDIINLWQKSNIMEITRIKASHIENFGIKEYTDLLKQASIRPDALDAFWDELTKKQLCIVAVSILSLVFRRHEVNIKNLK
jgi:hypothetical protein